AAEQREVDGRHAVDEVPGEIVEAHAQAAAALSAEQGGPGRIARALSERKPLDLDEAEPAPLQPPDRKLPGVVEAPDREDRHERDGDEGDEEQESDEKARQEDDGSLEQREEGFHDAHLSFGAAWQVAQSSNPCALLPSWHLPQATPFSILACVNCGAAWFAERGRMGNSAGWQVVQSGLPVSTWDAWRKVTTPGLSVPCGRSRSLGRRGRLPARTAPVRPSVRRAARRRMRFMTTSSLSLEEPPGQLVPVVLVEGARDAMHRRSAVLQDAAELRREALGELPRRRVQEAAGRIAGEKVLEVAGQPARLDLHEPARAIRVAQRVRRVRARGLVQRYDVAVDRREHIEELSARDDREGFLALPRRRDDRGEAELVERAHELVREVVEADFDDSTLRPCPCVAGVKVDVVRNLEPAEAERVGRSLALDEAPEGDEEEEVRDRQAVFERSRRVGAEEFVFVHDISLFLLSARRASRGAREPPACGSRSNGRSGRRSSRS